MSIYRLNFVESLSTQSSLTAKHFCQHFFLQPQNMPYNRFREIISNFLENFLLLNQWTQNDNYEEAILTVGIRKATRCHIR